MNKQVEQDKKQLSEKINLLEKDNDELKLSFGNQITDLLLKHKELEIALKQSKEKEIFCNIEIEKINSLYVKSQEEINYLKNERLSLSENLHNSEKVLSLMQEKLIQAQTQMDDLKQQKKDQQKQLLDYSAKLGQFEEIISSLRKRLKKEKPAKL
jgi:chromosome segregation ATPase